MKTKPLYNDLPLQKGTLEQPMDMFVEDGYLVLSSDIYYVCVILNIKSVSSFVSYLQTFPDTLAKYLDLNSRQLRLFHLELLRTVRDYVPNRILIRSSRPDVSFGSINEN